MKEKGLVEGEGFIIGASYRITKSFSKDEEFQERWSIIYPRILT